MRYLKALAIVLVTFVLVPAPAWAQEEDDRDAVSSRFSDPDVGWDQHRFHAGAFFGSATGGTSLGLIENVFFRSTYNLGTDNAVGFRVGYVFAPRFDAELEYSSSSPGMTATLTDLSGQGKTEVDFADLDLKWITASVNYSMIERTRRIVPYLTIGMGMVRADSSIENIVKARKLGLIFGAGLRVRIVDMIALRADARGLRSGFGAKQVDGDKPGVFVGDFSASNFVWTVGVDVRF